MTEAYVIDAVRTAVGKRGGSLAGVHPVDLGAYAWRGLLDRVDVDPAAVDDLIVAGGMQNMSQIPISSAMTVGEQFGFTSPTNESKQWLHRYGDQEISQFRGSELIAEKWNLSREEMERYALTSHERAFAAIRGGHFDNEII